MRPEILKCERVASMRHACAFPRRALAGPSRKSAALQNCNRVRDKVIRDTSADKRKPGDPLFFLMVNAQLAAQRADMSKVVPQKGSKSRSNQPPAAGGPSIKPPPRKPDCSGQAGVSAWRHHPARCRDCTTPRTAADSDLPSAGQQRKPYSPRPAPRGLFFATTK